MFKQFESYDTEAQKQAILNEFKGNLFEYLVARLLAKHYGVEGSFLTQINSELQETLQQYELWLRQHCPELLNQLPLLAQESASFLQRWPKGGVEKIMLIGKLVGGEAQKRYWKEGDLIIKTFKFGEVPISLKLCRENSFVNTKSGGAKSFLTAYFSASQAAEQAQLRFNEALDGSYLQMIHELYQEAGLEFMGKWDEKWCEAGLSELPGQLSPTLRAIILQHYYRVIAVLHTEMKLLYNADPVQFRNSLYPILGLGDPRIIQLICYHSNARDHAYKRSSLLEMKGLEVETSIINWKKFEPMKSSFAINFRSSELQIRVKPMNRFTAQALKINCSVRSA